MEISYSHDFNKKIKKIPKKVVDKFFERLELFKVNLYHPILKNHKLHGEYAGYSSINITSNFRAIFKYTTEDQVVFYDIGTHPELYG